MYYIYNVHIYIYILYKSIQYLYIYMYMYVCTCNYMITTIFICIYIYICIFCICKLLVSQKCIHVTPRWNRIHRDATFVHRQSTWPSSHPFTSRPLCSSAWKWCRSTGLKNAEHIVICSEKYWVQFMNMIQ